MATNETVTIKLMVAADGALRALDQFDVKMTDAANASVKTGAAVEAFNKQLARQRSAMEAGVPIMKARAAAMNAEERALQSMFGRADPIAKARLQAERDLGRASAAASNLVVQGKLAEADALRMVQAIEAQHAAQIDAAIAGAGRLAAANDNLANSYQRVGTTSKFATANIAAQFQDIAVTSAMGMSPLQIALQQGTQLSSVLGGQGLRGTVMALGGAFASLFSPVSLATLAVVGLGSAGIQAFMQMGKGAESATDALEKHVDWLEKTLTGYERAQAALAGFIETATTRPAEAVESNLEAARIAALKEVDALITKIDAKESAIADHLTNLRLGGDLFTDIIQAASGMEDLGLSASSTSEEVNGVVVQLTRLANETGASDQARQYARDLLGLVDQLVSARVEVDSLAVSLNNLPNDIPIIVRMHGLQGVADAVAQLQAMTPDLRSQREVADDVFANNVGGARSLSEINALVEAHERFNEALAEQEKRAAATALDNAPAQFGDERKAA